MPFRTASFVVIGLTNGPGFSVNPCLRPHVRWAQQRHRYAAAYAVVSYPHPRQLRRFGRGPLPTRGRLHARLWNAGYAQAKHDVVSLRQVGFPTPAVWIDVEPSSRAPWSRHRDQNAAVLRGVVAGFRHFGYRVGIYSTHLIWRSIAGRARLGLPEWRTAGPATTGAALHQCTHEQIQGGPAVLAQWWGPHRDFDVLCARPTAGHKQTWFIKY